MSISSQQLGTIPLKKLQNEVIFDLGFFRNPDDELCEIIESIPGYITVCNHLNERLKIKISNSQACNFFASGDWTPVSDPIWDNDYDLGAIE